MEGYQPRRLGNGVVVSFAADYAATPVMIALLLPAVQQAREAARRSQSKNNLKQIGLAMHNYHDTYNHFPPAASRDAKGEPLLSWRVHILPYLDQMNLYKQFRLDEPWDSPHNRPLIEKMPLAYSNPNLNTPGKTTYLLLTGKGAFGGKAGKRMSDFTQGLSNTLMAVEADADRAVIWTKPEDLDFDPETPFAGLGHLRAGGFHALFVDGSVRFLANELDPASLRSFATGKGE
jgi:hypothetical protein